MPLAHRLGTSRLQDHCPTNWAIVPPSHSKCQQNVKWAYKPNFPLPCFLLSQCTIDNDYLLLWNIQNAVTSSNSLNDNQHILKNKYTPLYTCVSNCTFIFIYIHISTNVRSVRSVPISVIFGKINCFFLENSLPLIIHFEHFFLEGGVNLIVLCYNHSWEIRMKGTEKDFSMEIHVYEE